LAQCPELAAPCGHICLQVKWIPARMPGPTAAHSSSSGVSLGDLYSKCVQMVNENKVSTKNAFDLHLIDHMDDIVDSFMGGKKAKQAKQAEKEKAGNKRDRAKSTSSTADADVEEENRFHEASCTIEASARIYACRVDCVHTDTYRILGGLNSADLHDGEEEGKEGEDGKPVKRRRICGVNTLERNPANITQQQLEADEQSDPTFRRMSAAFDAGGAKGLLLGHLPVAEDLSIVFNGDVPLARATSIAKPMFAGQRFVRCDTLGFADPAAARVGLAKARLLPEVDGFRRQLYGTSCSMDASLPQDLDAILPASFSTVPVAQAKVASTSPAPLPAPALMESSDGPIQDFGELPDLDGNAEDDHMVVPAEPVPLGPPILHEPAGSSTDAALVPDCGLPDDIAPLPLADIEPNGLPEDGNSDMIAFEELFEKFCSGGTANQFAYFDDCWAKGAKDSKPSEPGVLTNGQVDGVPPLKDGAVVAAQEGREKPQKKPLFDLDGLNKPLKPIETEPVHKHQLSERAAQWQLHKDVPPYMIDRITMPSWQTWSKCDFACLGLRPHLMLKLVRKPLPDGTQAHSFTDLFSTVVVENPDAFPWLASEGRGLGSFADKQTDDVGGRADRDTDFHDDAGDDDFDGNGLPAHLDVDPQELFLQPDDKVVNGGEEDDLLDNNNPNDYGFAPDLDMDLDLADRPATVGSVDIAYSRNSKFVDVKLVKKHLWDCISDDIADVQSKQGEGAQTFSSFQDLVDRTVQRMPKAETENLSVAVCFICALHLCNEKGLELKTDPERPKGDFTVVGPAK